MTAMPIETIEISNSELKYKAWICIDSLHKGMSFGGCRFSKTVDRKEVETLAKCMTMKLAFHGLPVGGSKTGFQVDPNREDIEDVLSDFAGKAKPYLESKVMIGKDLGASDFLIDSIYSFAGIDQTTIVENNLGRSCPKKLREFDGYIQHMTAQGMVWAATAVLDSSLLKEVKAVIQGAGAVGIGTFYRLDQAGIKVVGISDHEKALFDAKGLSFSAVLELVDKGLLSPPSRQSIIERDALFSQDCDLVVLAANSNSVDAKLADSIAAKYILEGSNFGLVEEAREILFKKGKLVIPDILANSSSASMVARQMASANGISSKNLWPLIQKSIQDVCREAYKVGEQNHISMREAYIDIIFPAIKSELKSATFQ